MLSWNPKVDAETYLILVKETEKDVSRKLISPSNDFRITDLEPFTQYSFVVKVETPVEGIESLPFEDYTLPAAPRMELTDLKENSFVVKLGAEDSCRVSEGNSIENFTFVNLNVDDGKEYSAMLESSSILDFDG